MTAQHLHQDYERWVASHPEAHREFRDAIEDVLDDAGVTYDRVTSRVKKWRSFKAKSTKRDASGELLYPHPMRDIHDLIGVRITTYHSTEIPLVIEVMKRSFTVVKSIDKAAETRVSGGFGYGSHHLIAKVGDQIEELQHYKGMTVEIQLRTVLQHAWAEFEHDIRYKSPGGTIDPRVDRAFTLAAGLIELADQQFDQIAAIHNEVPEHNSDVKLSAATLPGVLAVVLGSRFPSSRSNYYGWLEELLSLNGITLMSELKELLSEADIAAVEKTMKYRFPPGQVRIIDDLLLKRFGQQHIDRTRDTGTRAASRPDRLAKRLKTMQAAGIVATNV